MEGEDAMPTPVSDDRLTYDDFVRFPDDGLRHEIIDGVHYVTASPNLRHQQLLGRLFYAIEDLVKTGTFKDAKSLYQEIAQEKYSITPICRREKEKM